MKKSLQINPSTNNLIHDNNIRNLYTIILSNYKSIEEKLQEEDNSNISKIERIGYIQKDFLSLAENEYINILGTNINFLNNSWDFSEHYKEGKQIEFYRYHFTGKNKSFNISMDSIILLKLYVFYLITENGIDCALNYGNFKILRPMLQYMTVNNICDLEYLTLEDLKKYIENRKANYTTKIKIKRAIKSFFIFYSFLVKDIYTKEFDDYFNEINTDIINATIINNKTALLSSRFYKAYCELLFRIVMDETKEIMERGLAGLLYIGTQTGLRGGELAILKANCITKLEYKNKKVGILDYRSTKNGTKNKIYTEAKTNASEKVIRVVETIQTLFDEERKRLNIDLLCPNTRSKYSVNYNEFPNTIRESKLQETNQKLCIEHHRELGILNTDEKLMFESSVCGQSIKRDYKGYYKEFNFKEDDVISVPTIKQFRVYFASDLYERGVDYRTISEVLNQESVEMWGYYVRPKNEIQDDIDFSKEIVSEIIRDDAKILGTKGDAFKRKIDEIIQNNNLHVEKDLDAIIEKVLGEIPIRAKTGGFCVKSNPRRECRHDAKTDEFLCAYGCCTNHCHMYFMADVTYNKFLYIKKLVNYNEQHNFKNQAQKELYKLDAVISQELGPELDELQSELTKHRKEIILVKHPNLRFVVDNYEYIREDIKLWNKKISLLNQKKL